jgi:hypothetical protein
MQATGSSHGQCICVNYKKSVENDSAKEITDENAETATLSNNGFSHEQELK